jgi:hypothetical protein
MPGAFFWISWTATVVTPMAASSCRRHEPAPAPTVVSSSTSRGGAHDSIVPPRAAASEQPIADGDLQVVQDRENGWPSTHAPVLLEYRSYVPGGEKAKYIDLFFGLHIDGDGSVWRFRYPSAEVPQCEYQEIPDAAARESCIYQDSTLVARCSSALLAKLKRAILELAEPGIEVREADLGAKLTLGAAGSRESKPTTVAVCGGVSPPQQLRSLNAGLVIDVFRRVRRAARLPAPCSAGDGRVDPRDLDPGSGSWTAR